MAGRPLVLVIGVEEALFRPMAQTLTHAGFEVALTAELSGSEHAFLERRPAAVILHDLLPGLDGWNLARRLRELSSVPIVFIAERREVFAVERALQVGDAYLTPPWNWSHLVARLAALLRRAEGLADDSLTYSDGRLRIDFARRQVTKDGRPVRLTDTEFKLLSYFVRRPNRVLTYAELLNQVWGHTHFGAKSHVSLYVRYLRKKLEERPADPEYFVTEWGVGYSFRPSAQPGADGAEPCGASA
jgi:two-component system KDP operon response regulator KdpE